VSDLEHQPQLEAPANGSSVESQTSVAVAPRLMKLPVPAPLLLQGIGSLVIWFLLFAAGLLVETVEYRLVLAPRSVRKQLSDSEFKAIVDGSPLLQYLAASPRTPGEPSAFTVTQAFVGSILCFTPINLALLTLVAGLVGGYSSHIRIETMPPEDLETLRKEHQRRYEYLQEPPMTAAMRGFIVYLCIVAGLYVAMDDPFKDPTPSQYIRLAGTLSVLAFMVGYDSSRLEDWFALVPRPGGRTARERGEFDDEGDGKERRETWGEEVSEISRRAVRTSAPR
jgi:hypothetical protein